MGKKIKRSFSKNSNKNFTPNTLYALNISFPQAFELLESDNLEEGKKFIESFVIVGLVILMMAQISLSANPSTTEETDKLPSYKDLKDRIVGEEGMLVSACFGITVAYPYGFEEIEAQREKEEVNPVIGLVRHLVVSQTGNTKRLKASKDTWLKFARGEMGAAKGQMLSCPSTNLKKLNIDGAEVQSYDLTEALNNLGFDKETYLKYGLNPISVRTLLRKYFLLDKNGRPMKELNYDEPKHISSRIQNEILGDNIVRGGSVNVDLVKGMEPENPISKSILSKYLNKSELFAYTIAIRTGDTPMVKKFTHMATTRSKSHKKD